MKNLREYNKKWISERKLKQMSQIELEQFLSNMSIDIPFKNYDVDDLIELCFEKGLVISFATRGKKKAGMTKLDLLKLFQKHITENNSNKIFEKNGTITITITK